MSAFVSSVTPTITAGAYSAADVVGGLLTFQIAGAGSGAGVFNRLSVADKGQIKAAGTLHLFYAKPTAFADNAAYAPVDADASKEILQVAIAAGDYVDQSTTYSQVFKSFDPVYVSSTTNDLYGYWVVSGTPDYTAGGTSGLVFNLYCIRL